MELGFISDEKLVAAVGHLLRTAHTARVEASQKLNRNVIDPFAAMFQMAGFELDHKAWVQFELVRQAQKSLQNDIGEFHQIILGSMDGWEDMGTGSVVDVVNHEKKIIAEVKNKYNTVSGGHLAEFYHALEAMVMPKSSPYCGYTAYFVTIIPRNPERFDEPFTPSDRMRGENCAAHPLIRTADGATFYDIASGQPGTLRKLYAALPETINRCAGYGYELPDVDKLMAYFRDAFGETGRGTGTQ